MMPHLSQDLAKALDEQGGKLILEHPLTGQPVVLIAGQRLEDELREASHHDAIAAHEMLYAAALANRGPDGWDAPGMEVYDTPAYDPPANQP
jgi:hypothetical protein